MDISKKINYYYNKIPELKRNLEPLTHLMIRTTGETMYEKKYFLRKYLRIPFIYFIQLIVNKH